MPVTEGLLAGAVLALAVAGVARWRGWSIPIPVVAAGVLVGLAPFGPRAPAEAGELFLIILAPLVFGEALSSSYLDLRRERAPILALAIGLVVVTSVAAGAVATALVPGIPWSIALALGAILAPTDAVAVATVARRAGLPHRVVTVLEGESLVNDGSGLTLLRVALVWAAAGSLTASQVGGVLLFAVVGGLAVGLIVGAVLRILIRRSRDPLIANAALLLAPFPAYLGAEALGGSGILAVVAAALVAAHAMHAEAGFRGRPQSVAAWRQVTFLLQAFAFFLIGLELPETLIDLTGEEWRLIAVLVPAIMGTLIACRLAFTALLAGLGGLGAGARRDWRSGLLVGWAGTRGPVSGLAVFTLPVVLASGEPLPYRDLLLATTLVIIVATLLLTPTIAPLARRLGLAGGVDVELQQRIQRALLLRSLESLDRIAEEGEVAGASVPATDIAAMRRDLEARLAVRPEGPAAETLERADARRRLEIAVLLDQQGELIRLRDERGLPDVAIRPLLHDLDVRLQALRTE